jgi:hypothetical protein
MGNISQPFNDPKCRHMVMTEREGNKEENLDAKEKPNGILLYKTFIAPP